MYWQFDEEIVMRNYLTVFLVSVLAGSVTWAAPTCPPSLEGMHFTIQVKGSSEWFGKSRHQVKGMVRDASKVRWALVGNVNVSHSNAEEEIIEDLENTQLLLDTQSPHKLSCLYSGLLFGGLYTISHST